MLRILFEKRNLSEPPGRAKEDTEDGEEYSPSGKTQSRNIILETVQGTVIDYLDEIEAKSVHHDNLHNMVSVESCAKNDFERNMQPLILTDDIDSSENGNMKVIQQGQSQYWVTIAYTLFMSVMSWLEVAEWNKTTGDLEEGDEVTVNGEMRGA